MAAKTRKKQGPRNKRSGVVKSAQASRNIHDVFFRAAFSDPQIAYQAVRMADPALAARIVPESLTLVDTAFVNPRFKSRYADLNFRAVTTDGKSIEIVLLYEHKSYYAPPIEVFLQVADYRTEFWRKHYLAGVARMREAGQEGPPPDLPIVIPVMVYHGDQHFGAVRLSEQWQAAIPDQLLRFFPDHEILLCDLHGLSDEEILAVGFDLLAGVLLSLKHARDTNYLRKNFVKLLELGGQTAGTDLHPVFSLVDLFQYIVSPAGITEEEYNDMSRSFSPEFSQKHQTVIDVWFSRGREEGRQEGLQKGLQRGRQEGQAEAFQQVIRNMLKRFPDWSDQAIASALGIAIEQVPSERAKIKVG